MELILEKSAERNKKINKIEKLKGWKIVEEDTKDFVAKVKKGPPVHVIKYIVVLENEKSL